MARRDATAVETRAGKKTNRGGEPLVHEVMTPAGELATVSPEATLREVAALLAARHVSGAPVLAGSDVVGVISAADLLDFAATTPENAGETAEEDEWDDWDAAAAWDGGSEWTGAGEEEAVESPGPRALELDALDQHTAGEVMCRRLLSIAPGASLGEAARAMRAAGVHRLLVLDDGRLAGLITTTDVLRAVAEGKLGGA